MGTASTMKSLSEILGMMLPGTAAIPAHHPDRVASAEATGERIVAMVDENLRPSDLLTRQAFSNAIKVLGALGGSTNAILHLTAIAGRRGIVLRPQDFRKDLEEIPLLVDVQPLGQYNMDDLFAAGGVSGVLRQLLPVLDTKCLTATGRMSGTGYGTVVLHVSPESAIGGPLALVEGGDPILLDIDAKRIDLLVAQEVLNMRRARWQRPQARHLRGYLKLFADHVLQAPEGCDLDFLRPSTENELPFVEPTIGRTTQMDINFLSGQRTDYRSLAN